MGQLRHAADQRLAGPAGQLPDGDLPGRPRVYAEDHREAAPLPAGERAMEEEQEIYDGYAEHLEDAVRES